jgi:YD repeat-containing protein
VSLRALLLAILLTAPAIVRAAVPLDPNTTRGFAGKVYQLGDIDSVNVFNGNLTVRIPLGQSYTLGPTLSYQFVLTNNSKVWDYEVTLDGKRRAIPEAYSEAGLGWTLSLGKLIRPRSWVSQDDWIYVSPDGAHRGFSRRLSVNPTVAVTVDGSYLRLTLNTTADTHSVEFPDGTIHEFHVDGRLKKIRDRFDNWVAVAYDSVICGAQSCDRWTITDGHSTTASGRSHTVTFANKSAKYNQANFQQVVATVALAAFGGGTGTYRLYYADDGSGTGTAVRRERCADNMAEESDVLAPMLARVTLADGSEFGMQYTNAAIDGACESGGIKRLTLPTGGALAWDYGSYFMTLEDCNDQDFWTTSFSGVTKRSVYLSQAAGAQPDGVWTYTSWLGPPAKQGTYAQSCNGVWESTMLYAPEELTTTIFGPTGDRTVHHFSVYPPQALGVHSNFKGGEYTLPLSRNDELEPGGRALSSAVYDSAGTLQRKTYLAYESEGYAFGVVANSRLQRQRVIDVTDTACAGGCRVDTDHSEFDGYGHYRRTVASSTVPSSVSRTTFTNFNPGSSAAGTDAGGAAYFSSTEPWILGTYDETWVTEGSKTRKALAVFDAARGVLKSLRTLRATDGSAAQLAVSSADTLNAWCREGAAGSRGFVTSERSLGGDLAGIPAGDPCTAARGAGHYFITHGYTFAGAALAGHTAQYAGTAHFIADESFDPKTGRIATSRDSAGVTTGFTYDTSGRLTAVKPAGEASTTYQYQLAGNPPNLIVRHCLPGLEPCETGSLTEGRYYYDGIGRLIEERRKMPPSATQAPQWSALWTSYDPLGRTKTRSVPVTTPSGGSEPSTATASTSWDYDFLGRVTREIRPDGSSAGFAYSGAREIRKSIADPGTASQLRSTERYDGAGRLTSVIQPSGPTSAASRTGADVLTRYTYDLADRLVSVSMTGAETAVPQARSFAYDGRGFLSEESHPETGTIRYEDYDARGHAGKRLPAGGHSVFKHRYTYDAAERLIQVDTGSPDWTGSDPFTEFRLQKKFVFATANDGANRKKGKLEEATRENYPACRNASCFGARIRVVESYRYDASGRTSGRTTVLDDLTSGQPVLIKSIDQLFSYNDLGLPASVSYPVCDGCGIPPGPNPRRDISLGYAQGMLQSIGGYVSQLTYGPTGAPTGIVHSNGMTDAIALDSSGRPRSITFGAWSSCGTPPAIVIPPADKTIPSGTSTSLEVTASGTSLQYQWYDATASPPAAIAGATQREYVTLALTATKSYFVRVSNACRSVDSATATVTVTVTCGVPSITAQPQSRTIGAGTSTTLSVTATGASLNYQWYRGAAGDTTQPVGMNAASYTTPALFVTASYWVRVSNGCSTVNSATATVTVPLPAPANLRAVLESSTSVRLTWSPAAGAAKYEVWRRSGGGFALVTGQTQSPWIDTQRVWGRTYVYQVRAVDANNSSPSPFSGSDLATLMSYAAVVPGTPIVDTHWQELLSALNALRAANGDPALTWTGILPAGVPAPARNVLIRRQHLESLRQRFTSALQALQVSSPPYTNPNLVTEPLIRAVHVTELQQRAQ